MALPIDAHVQYDDLDGSYRHLAPTTTRCTVRSVTWLYVVSDILANVSQDDASWWVMGDDTIYRRRVSLHLRERDHVRCDPTLAVYRPTASEPARKYQVD